MKVVFLEDLDGVAQGGEVKDVKPGFARNYLIPQNLAVAATHDSLQRLDKIQKQAEKDRAKKLDDVNILAEKLSGIRLDLEMRSGKGGRLYGSVTNTIVSTKLSELLGTNIDRKLISIPESIRDVGSYTATIKLHSEVKANIHLLVHPTDVDAEEFLIQLEKEVVSDEQESQVELETEISDGDDSELELINDSATPPDDETPDQDGTESDSNIDSDTEDKVNETTARG